MSEIPVEFLEAHGFKQKPFPKDLCWLKYYSKDHFVKVNASLDQFAEFTDCWTDHLTMTEFVDRLKEHQKAIDQE